MEFDYYIPILKIPAIVGVIFTLVGCITYIFPPKKINMMYGYRTKNSMRTKQAWRFSQIYGAKKTIESGVWLLILSLLGYVMEITETNALIIGVVLVIIFAIYPIYRTEKALKSRFPKRKR